MKKKALLIGINYKGTSGELNGCINDVLNVKKFLLSSGYEEKDIEVLTEEGALLPTKSNIYYAMEKLFLSCADKKYLHYSGHGSSTRDNNGDEIDGKDEVIVPLDYQENGFIKDDDIRFMIDTILDPRGELMIVMDCCHSGTIVDLRYKLKKKKNTFFHRYFKKDYYFTQNRKYSNTVANVYLISGCRDDQTSADAFIGSRYQGALTFSLLSILSKMKYDIITWVDLIDSINTILYGHGYNQRAVLTTGKKMKKTKLFNYF